MTKYTSLPINKRHKRHKIHKSLKRPKSLDILPISNLNLVPSFLRKDMDKYIAKKPNTCNECGCRQCECFYP